MNMNIPAIGSARGIFEIFVPGMFLLVNIVAALYVCPYPGSEMRLIIAGLFENQVLALIITVSFGYLIGMLLRLLRPDLPDKLSARYFVPIWNKNARDEDGNLKSFVTDSFPYLKWLKDLIVESQLPKEAKTFYKETWGHKRKKKEGRRQFVNYCKVMLASANECAAAEVYIAESLTRYISGMFYALVVAEILFSIAGVWQFASSEAVHPEIVILFVAYLVALIVILRRFRFIRIKEVEAVFSASYHNKEKVFPKTYGP